MENKRVENMKLAVICIGDELLKGAVLNTNLAYMASSLLENGIQVQFSAEVQDTREGIVRALEKAFEQADWVITSGGLGPTADDVTKEYIAAYLGYRLEENGEVAVSIMQYWRERHGDVEMPTRILNQSLVPENALILRNRYGTAPGLLIRMDESHPRFPGKNIIMLPGPPDELEPMFKNSVLPVLKKEVQNRIYSKCFYICGIGESFVEERMLPVLNRNPGLSAAYCASAGLVKLFLKSASCEILSEGLRAVRKEFAGEMLSDSVSSPAEEILQLLREKGETLATAESCTGGLIAKMITDIPGASDVYQGSAVSYANRIKESILGVKKEALEAHGAVSAETAEEMVRGLARNFDVTAAIATTGIAGPDGGTPEKPVGLVYVGLMYRERCEILELHLSRSRQQIRERAAAQALIRLRQMILEEL